MNKSAHAKRAGLYVRVSTGHQTTEPQLQALRDICRQRGWDIVDIYEDKNESGKKESRPAFDRLLHDCAQGKIDTVLVFRCDRFSRSVRHFVNTLHTLERLGVGFVSASEGIDLTVDNPLTKVVMLLISALAEMELSILKERQTAGIRSALERGVRFGRPHAGFDIRRAMELQSEGLSLRKIAKTLGVSVSTLSRNLPKAA